MTPSHADRIGARYLPGAAEDSLPVFLGTGCGSPRPHIRDGLAVLAVAPQSLELAGERIDLRFQPLEARILALRRLCPGIGRSRFLLPPVRRQHLQRALEQGDVLLAHLLELAK